MIVRKDQPKRQTSEEPQSEEKKKVKEQIHIDKEIVNAQNTPVILKKQIQTKPAEGQLQKKMGMDLDFRLDPTANPYTPVA